MEALKKNNEHYYVEIPVEGIGKVKITRYKKTVNLIFPKPTSILNMETKVSVRVGEALLKRAIETYIFNGVSKAVLFTHIKRITEGLLNSIPVE